MHFNLRELFENKQKTKYLTQKELGTIL